MTDLAGALKAAVTKLYGDILLADICVTAPNSAFGDASSNIAFALAGRVDQPVATIAAAIAGTLRLPPAYARVEIALPGYLNFWLDVENLADNLETITTVSRTATPEVVLFEFGTPNTHKLPHIGHLYNYIYGESGCRLLEALGHTVYRDNYQGDVGLHVAKCLWAYPTVLRQSGGEPPTESLERVRLLQAAYQLGAAAYQSNAKDRVAIDDLTTKLYHADPAIMPRWDETRAWSLAYYRQFEGELGIHFDRFYLESETAAIGQALVYERVGDMFEKHDGAIVFRGDGEGRHTRVFINSRGNPTYEAKDIGLAALKLRDFPDATRHIIITANEQMGYWQVVKAAISRVFADSFSTRTIEHIGYGLITLTTGKMSSRTGEMVTAADLVDSVTAAMADCLDRERHSPGEVPQVAKKVALAAIKYSFLRTAAHKNIAFDMESSIAREGNCAPYILYTLARCHSILKKAPLGVVRRPANLTAETDLLRHLVTFDAAVSQAVRERSPHHVATFVYELARRFNAFYDRQTILGAAGSAWRVKLTATVADAIEKSLRLLGIEPVRQL